jgi:hypothetical protein
MIHYLVPVAPSPVAVMSPSWAITFSDARSKLVSVEEAKKEEGEQEEEEEGDVMKIPRV